MDYCSFLFSSNPRIFYSVLDFSKSIDTINVDLI